MIESLSLIRRRPDLPQSDFVAHYEQAHAPLARRLLPLLGYVRAYPLNEGDDAGGHAGLDVGLDGWGFEAFSEFWYASPEVLAGIVEALAGEAGRELAEDELRFMHKPGNASFTATTCSNGTRPAPGTATRYIALVTDRRGDEARAASDFATQHEAQLAAAPRLDVIAHERRYVASPIKAPEPAPARPLACVESFWLEDERGADALFSACRRRGVAPPVATREFGALPSR